MSDGPGVCVQRLVNEARELVTQPEDLDVEVGGVEFQPSGFKFERRHLNFERNGFEIEARSLDIKSMVLINEPCRLVIDDRKFDVDLCWFEVEQNVLDGGLCSTWNHV